MTSSGPGENRQIPWPPPMTAEGPMPGGPKANPHLPATPRVPLTREEMQVLKECSSESFWYRCVPFTIIGVGTTQMLTNRGFLKPHPKYGALLKNLGASLVAYILGKISYQPACRDKIMRLDSPLGEAMRSGKRGNAIFQDLMEKNQQASEQVLLDGHPEPGTQSGSQIPYSDSNNYAQGLDDSKRPSVDTDMQAPLNIGGDVSKGQFKSYDDLRAQNRRQFRGTTTTTAPPARSQEVTPQVPSGGSDINDPWGSGGSQQGAPRYKRNQYGDIIET